VPCIKSSRSTPAATPQRPVLTGLELTPDGERALHTDRGMRACLSCYFGLLGWVYDPDDDIWWVVDRHHTGPGRRYACFRRGGDWRPLEIPAEAVQ
jgi:hypothetical protein